MQGLWGKRVAADTQRLQGAERRKDTQQDAKTKCLEMRGTTEETDTEGDRNIEK